MGNKACDNRHDNDQGIAGDGEAGAQEGDFEGELREGHQGPTGEQGNGSADAGAAYHDRGKDGKGHIGTGGNKHAGHTADQDAAEAGFGAKPVADHPGRESHLQQAGG